MSSSGSSSEGSDGSSSESTSTAPPADKLKTSNTKATPPPSPTKVAQRSLFSFDSILFIHSHELPTDDVALELELPLLSSAGDPDSDVFSYVFS